MDKIEIKDLQVFCNHGLYPEEKKLGQKFLVTAILYTNTRVAGLEDDLTKSINYGSVSHMIKNFMENNTFNLIESVCENLASHLLTNIENLTKVNITLKKPWAPIKLPLEWVSVEIHRQWHIAYLSIGSNMGNRELYLKGAISELRENKNIIIQNISNFIETKPYGYTEQDDFLNGCLSIKTLLTPIELLKVLNKIESNAGRTREIHWGPRTLDLDILLYDDIIMDTEILTIPHSEMHLRNFVLDSLIEIAPKKRHPILNKTITEIRNDLIRQV